MKKLARICIGIVHFGEPEVLKRLLDSIPLSYWNQLMILDHNPTPVSVDSPIRVFHNPNNPGFAAGMNYLISKSIHEGADYFIGLNNDLELKSGAIDSLIKGCQSNGAVVTQGVLVGEEGRILTARHRLNPLFHWVHNLDRHKSLSALSTKTNWETDFICGAFFGVDLETFQRNPVFFDEDFHLYHEDIEWSLRLREKGLALALCSEAVSFHYESSATGGKLTKLGVAHRWKSLKTYLRKTCRSPFYRILSIGAFWIRMLFVWKKYGYR